MDGDGYNEQKINYEIETDTLLLFHEKGIEKAQINFISADSLRLSSSISSDNETQTNKKRYNRVYEQLPNYHLVERQAELFEELTTSIYKIGEDTLEFSKKGLYAASPTSFHINEFWNLIRYDDELFIVNVGYNVPPIHIKSFNKEKIIGVIYGRENRIIEYTKIPIQEKFNLSNLAGRWERFYEGGGPPLPPEYPQATKKFYEQKTLHISDTTMLSYHFYKRDTVAIQSDKLKNYIIFYDKRGRLQRWKIHELTKNKLTVETNDKLFFEREKATFKRIE